MFGFWGYFSDTQWAATEYYPTHGGRFTWVGDWSDVLALAASPHPTVAATFQVVFVPGRGVI